MAADENQHRPGFSGLLTELTDSDVVIEIGAAGTNRRLLDVGPARFLEDAVTTSYRALAGSVPIQLEIVAVLEEVSKRSLSLWLRTRHSGDGALADSADASLLKFLARGTLAMIAWMDGSPTLQLSDLQQAIRVLAWGTSITTAAHPVLPDSSKLVGAISAWQKAKAAFHPGDWVRIITNNGSAKLDLDKRIEEPRTLLLSRKLVNHSADIIFVVEMPDYEGSGQWQLKHGETRTTALAEPGTSLDGFYRRELDIRPGDALRCRVDVETSYGPDHEVLAERYRIIDIIEVLPASRNETVPASPGAAEAAEHEPVQELEEAAS